jgi:hypothetical protein
LRSHRLLADALKEIAVRELLMNRIAILGQVTGCRADKDPEDNDRH